LNSRIAELEKTILEKDSQLKSNEEAIRSFEKDYAQKIEMLIKKM
jgi:hypothetical protein